MVEEPLQVNGKQSDYNLQMVATDDGQTPVLIGVSGQAVGQIHSLEGARAIQFQDGVVDLLETPLGAGSESSAVADAPPPSSVNSAVQSANSLNGSSGPDGSPLEMESGAEQAQNVSGVNTTPSVVHPTSPGQYADAPANPAELLAQPAVADLPTANLPANQEPTGPQTELTPGSTPTGTQASASSASSLAASAVAPVMPSASLFAAKSNGLPSAMAVLGGANPPIPDLQEIFGTPGPDRLIGSAYADGIDGMVNVDLVNGSFNELLMGLDGNDLLFYRGFLGEYDAASIIRANLLGGAGNDEITVSLDQVSDIDVDGGSGVDHLILQSMHPRFDPWSPQFMSWSWDFAGAGPKLVGQYSGALHPNAQITEASPSIELVSTASGSAMQLVRPSSEQATSLVGSSLSDLLISSESTNRIEAGSGNDIVIARQGDTVQLGEGINTLYGAGPEITLSYEQSPYAVDVDLSKRLGMVFDSADSIYSIDRLLSGAQHLTGSANNDRLVGDTQDNIIRTGGGRDLLTGGDGADRFIVDIDPDAGATRIQDFSLAQGDSISLNLSALDLSASGLLGEDAYFSYLISDAVGNVVHQGLVNQNAVEEGAILQLQLQAQDSTLYWVRPDATLTPLVDFGVDTGVDQYTDLNQLDEDQWNQFLSVDYL